jgi:hypothetical protein
VSESHASRSPVGERFLPGAKARIATHADHPELLPLAGEYRKRLYETTMDLVLGENDGMPQLVVWIRR